MRNVGRCLSTWLLIVQLQFQMLVAFTTISTTRRTLTSHKMTGLKASRRDVLEWAGASFVVASNADQLSPELEPSVISDAPSPESAARKVLDIVKDIPTFIIVDERGVAYCVVGEDAKPVAYFFTEFEEADRILKAAAKSADQAIGEAKKQGQILEPEQAKNPWKQARVSTVPLESAVALASNRQISKSTRNYFYLSPSDKDVDDALELTGQTSLAENKVPLFYFNDFTLPDGVTSPLFFRKSQLIDAFKKQSKTPLPPVQVTELGATLAALPTLTEKLVIVPFANAEKRAQQCVKKGGSEPPLRLGERNLVL